MRALGIAAAIVSFVASLAAPAGAIVNMREPNLNLTVAVVTAGGGPKHFDAAKLLGVLAGPNAPAEVARLEREYGATKVRSFVAVFTYAIDDSLAVAQREKIALPSKPEPNPKDGGELSGALYEAGTTPSGKFDVGYMLEGLISHPIHHVVMHDIDAKFTPATNADFHVILTTTMKDLRAVYGL